MRLQRNDCIAFAITRVNEILRLPGSRQNPVLHSIQLRGSYVLHLFLALWCLLLSSRFGHAVSEKGIQGMS